MQNKLIIIPRELVYAEVAADSTYEQSFIIRNKDKNEILDIFFDTQDKQKYKVNPKRIQLKAYQEQLVVVQLSVEQMTSAFTLKDEIVIKETHSNASIISIPITILPSSQISHLSGNNSHQQEFLYRDDEDELGMRSSGGQGQFQSQDSSKMQYSSYQRDLQESHGFSLISQSNYRDNQVQAYKKIIDEKDKLIEKLESDLLIERDRFENLKLEQNSSMEIEKINSKMSSLLKDINPDIAKAVELALQKERVQNENKNQKVMQLFQQKDQVINEKEKRVIELQNITGQLEDLNAELNQRIQELETNFDEYQKHNNNSLANSQKEVVRDIESLQMEVQSYKKELEERQRQSELVAQELQLAQKRMEEYESISNKESQLVQDLKQENIQLLDQIGEFCQKEKYWQEYYERKMSESKSLSERVEDYENIQEEICKLSQEHERQMEEKEEEIRHLANELHASEQQSQHFRYKCETMQQEIDSLNNQLQNYKYEQQSSHRREMEMIAEQTLESQSNTLNNRLQAQDISNSPALKLNEFNQSRIAKLESDINQLQLNFNLVNSQLNEEKKQKKVLSEKLNQKNIENDHLLDDLQNNQKSDSSNYQILCSKYEQVVRQLEHAEKQRKSLQEELNTKPRDQRTSSNQQNDNNDEDLQSQLRILKLKYESLEKKELRTVEDKTRLELLYNDLLSEFNSMKTEFSIYKSHHRYNQQSQPIGSSINNNDSHDNRMNYNYTSTDSNNNNNNNNNQNENNYNNDPNQQSKIDTLKKTIAELESAIEKWEEKEKDNKKKMVILEKERENLQQNARSMASIIDEMEYNSKNVEDKYRSDVIDLQQKNIELQGNVYSLEKETAAQREQIEQNHYLKEKIEIVSKVNQKFESDIKQLKMKNQEEMQELKQELDNHQQIKQLIENRLEEYQHDNKILSKTNDDKDKIIKKLSDENDDLDHRCQLFMAENSKINELNRKYGIEVERVCAQLNASKEQTEWAEIKFKEILKEKEDLQKELNILEIQTKHTDIIDAKVIEELNDLREQMRRLTFEKERLFYALKIQEEQQQDAEGILLINSKMDVFKFMKLVELKFKTCENDAHMEIGELKQQLIDYKRDLEIQIQRYSDLKIIVDKKEQDYLTVAEEKRIVNIELNKQRDAQIDIQRQVEQLNQQKQFEDKQKNELIASLQQELQKQEEVVQVMREEMMNQNRTFKEVKNSQDGAIQNMKQKFQNDLNELYQKFNGFVNTAQSEQQKKQQSTTSIRDDKKYIQRLFETYAENVNVVSHKEALIKKLSDKERKQLDKEKALTKEVERLTDINKKYAEDFQIMQKKGYTLSQGSKRSIPQKSFNLLNDTNISKNPNKNQNQNPNITSNDISVSFINQNEDTANKSTLKLKDIATLEAQLFTTRTNLEQSKEEITFLKDYNKDLKEDIEKLQRREEDLLEENRGLQIKLQDQLRQNKSDKDKYLGDIEQVKTQYFTPENFQEKLQQLEQKDKLIKELKDDVNRKKDLVQSVKQLKEEQSYDMKTLQVEIERLQKELEKYKIRANKATQAMSGPTKETKSQIENLKLVEKKLTQENEELQEQLKKSKVELGRANITIKDLRGKQEVLQANGEQMNENNEKLEKSQDQLKKLKSEVDRKETAMKQLKSKLENATSELEELRANSKNLVTKNDYLSEQKKGDQTKSLLKKSEAQISMLVFLLKRIFRDSFVSLQKVKASSRPITSADFATQNTRSQGAPTSSGQVNKFSDSVNILGLSPEEIDQFLDPYTSSYKNVQSQPNYNTSHASEFYSDMMDRFERELENIDENINVNSLYQMLYSVIEERIEIVKSSKLNYS